MNTETLEARQISDTLWNSAETFMTQPLTPQFLDVPALLERSQPRRTGLRLWHVAGGFMLLVMVSAYLTAQGGVAATLVNVLSFLFMVGLMVVLGLFSWSIVQRSRQEQLQVQAIEELIRLRRWSEAAVLLDGMLNRPTRTTGARVQALIFLTSVLARYNRFEDAITVQNYLLENIPLDGGSVHGIKLARAMAMLREDHLFDADRAISELRQQVTRAGRAMNEAKAEEQGTEPSTESEAPQSLSAGLALVELYRDVKTGHPAEAIELFNSTLPALREQLGHRVADGYALAAKAFDLLGNQAEAQAHFHKATLLAPAVELHRRYPETASLSQKYQPATAPREAA